MQRRRRTDLHAQRQRRRDVLPEAAHEGDLDRRPRGDRRRRGRRDRRGRAARLQPPPGGDGRRIDAGSSTRRSTCSTSTAARCSASRWRAASSSCARSCAPMTAACASPTTSSARASPSSRRRRRSSLEGMIAKHRRSIYEPGKRSRSWLKIKIRPEQELVVGGWTPGEGAAKDLGARRRRRVRGRGRARRSCASRARWARASPRRRASGCASGWRRSRSDEFAVRSAAAARLQGPLGRGAQERRLGQAGDRDPRGARRLDARQHRPPGRVQGLRRGRQAADRGRSRDARSRRAETVREVEERDAAIRSEAMAPTPSPRSASTAVQRHRRRASGIRVGGERRRARRARRDDEGRHVDRRRLRAEAHEPRQGAVQAEGRRPGAGRAKAPKGGLPAPVTKRELVRYFARIAPAMLTHLEERPLNLQRFPNGADGPSFWQKDIPETAPSWLRRWREVGVEARDANEHLIARPGRGALLARQPGGVRGPRLDLAARRPDDADVRADRHRPGHEDDLGRDRHARAPVPDGARPPRRPRLPEDDRQARHPGLDPGRAEVHVPRDERLDRDACRGPSGRRSRTSCRGSGRRTGAAARRASTTRRTRTSRRSSRRTRCDRPMARPVSTPITWDELDDPDLRSDRWTIRTVVDRVERAGRPVRAGADRPPGAAAALSPLPPRGSSVTRLSGPGSDRQVRTRTR